MYILFCLLGNKVVGTFGKTGCPFSKFAIYSSCLSCLVKDLYLVLNVKSLVLS